MTAETYLLSAEIAVWVDGKIDYTRTFNSDWTWTDSYDRSGTWVMLAWNRFRYTYRGGNRDGDNYSWTLSADGTKYM